MIDQDRLDAVMNAFKNIHDNWAQKNRFEYVVVPSDDIRGKTLDQMKAMTFRVGVTETDSTTMTVQELVALFLLIKDQTDQMRRAAEGEAKGGERTYESTVNFAPSDDQIKAVLSGVQFTIHEEDKHENTTQSPVDKPDDFGLTGDRVKYVLSLVKKKANAALSGATGMHFRVYPPPEFLQNPAVTESDGIFDKLRGTVWWVRWYDDQYDQLGFMEFLVFINQIIQASFAFQQAQKAVQQRSTLPTHRASKHGGGWQPKKDRSRKPKKREETIQINVEGMGFAPAQLAGDEMIRILFSKVDLEKNVKPSQAMN